MKFTLAAALTAASLFAAGAAAAQSYGPAGGPGYGAPPRPRIACAADIQRLCSSAQPGRDAMRCLRHQAGGASPQCQASLQAARAMRAQRRAERAAAPAAAQSGMPSQYDAPPPQ